MVYCRSLSPDKYITIHINMYPRFPKIFLSGTRGKAGNWDI